MFFVDNLLSLTNGCFKQESEHHMWSNARLINLCKSWFYIEVSLINFSEASKMLSYYVGVTIQKLNWKFNFISFIMFLIAFETHWSGSNLSGWSASETKWIRSLTRILPPATISEIANCRFIFPSHIWQNKSSANVRCRCRRTRIRIFSLKWTFWMI